MFIFLGRTIKFAFQGFTRNIWLSVVTVVILVLTLFSVTIAAGINIIAEKAIESVEQKVDVSVYFEPDISEQEVLNVRYRLEELSQVESVGYISKEEALQRFIDRHQDDPGIIESIEEVGNPLGATLVVKAKSIDDYPTVLSMLESDSYADLIQGKSYDDNQQVINRLSDISSKVQRIGLIVSAVFIIIAILIIFNTIRINIYTHREEIGIMKLVGASNWFVRAPFLVESMLYAVLAVVIAIAVLYPLLGVIAPQVDSFFAGYNFDLVSYIHGYLIEIIAWQLGFAIVLSFISSSFAIGRYLRV
ncbi:MAG: permease-like cell division protein FtsX [Patescibacteria group bacterium]|nr:permease-like cell division protein FtsX [Patescibacteria group bacterium]MDD5715994.1 permease-like cell division protein FtsX [Patescibacteria group bacterium]